MALSTDGAHTAQAPPTSIRSRAAALIVFTALAMIAGLVSLAVVADGRELSQASSNDGGAWLVNRELGVVGHRNRAAGELSSFMRITDSPTAEVHQASGVIVVHDPATQLLHEVDARTFSEDLEPTLLPAGAQVYAVDGSVVIMQPDPVRVWRISPDRLVSLPSLADVVPEFELASPGVVAASPDGRLAVFDVQGETLHWLHDDRSSTSVRVPISGEIVSMTIVEASAALLSSTGQLVIVGPNDIEHDLAWSSITSDDQPIPAVLQQPSTTMSSADLAPATNVVGVSSGGAIVEVALGDTPSVTVRASIAGNDPLPPIVFDGCIYAVVTEPALLGVACDQLTTRRLDGAGSALRLRLVNGWVWVNDLADGGTWLASEGNDVELLDDWGLAERALQDEAEEEDGGSTSTPAADRTLFADANADGSVQDSDDFDPAEANVAPIAVDDTASTRLDRVSVVPVLANDIDVNNDILVIEEIVLLSGQAQISITPTRDEIQIAPSPGFAGTVEVEYWVSDGRSAPVSAFLTVDVAPIDIPNTPPVAETDVVATAPGHATTIDVLRNDRDPDGDAIALVGIESESGTLRWSPNGQVTFTPDSTTAAGWVELPYLIVDDLGAESTGVVRVEIRDRGANQEPDARNDQATTVAGRPVVLDLLENDSDPDGDELIIGSRPVLLEPDDATVRMSATDDGEFVFTADIPGTYLLSYTVTDSAIGGSEVDTARIRIDVLPVVTNTPPVAVRDDVVLAAGESQVVYVLDNDGDADGDVISIVDWQSAPGLRITEFFDAGGHVGFRIAAAPDAPRRSRFLYSISDGRSQQVSAPVVVTVVNRLPSDQPPIANDDAIEIRPGTTVEGIELLVNDFDPEGGPLRIVDVGSPGVAGAGSSVAISLDGRTAQLTVPAEARSSFTFSYDIEDQAGNRAGAVVRVQLIAPGATNRPPTARVDDVRTIQGVPVDIDALANDSDPDGDPIVLQGIIEQPAFGSAAVVANGQIRYRPDDGFTGTDVIRYAIVDSSGDQAIGEIFAGVVARDERNEAPVANDDAYSLAGASVLTPLDVLANDFDPEGDPLRVVDLTAVSHGIVAIDEFGRVQFGPPPRLAEPTNITFGYTIADNAGNQADAIVVIEMPAYELPLPTPDPTPPIEPTPTPEATPTPAPTPEPEPTPEATPPPNEIENQPPVAVSDTVGPLAAGAIVIVDVLANDFDPDGERDELRVVSVGDGAERNGAFVEVVAGDETTQVPYTIADADGAEASATITVLVNANRPPQVQARTVEIPFETPVELELSGQASDPDDDPLFFVCCDGIRGGSIAEVVTGEDRLTLTFTPNQGFAGQAGFAYIVDDQQGHQVAGSVSVIVGAPDNREPQALDNTVDLPQGATIAVDLDELTSDPDDDELTFTLASTPSNGVQTQSDGSVVLLTAPADIDEGTTTSFDYAVSDGPLSATGTVTIVITPGANEPPVAIGTTIDLAAGSSATVDLTQLSSDPDPEDQLVWQLLQVTSPDGMDVVLNGALVQVSAGPTLANEQAQIDYQVADRQGETATGLVIVNVTDPTAPPPTAVDDQANAQQGVPVTIDVLANDVDPLGGGLTVVSASAEFGTAAVTPSGVRFTASDITGAIAIQYTIRDVANRESSATVIVDTVAPPERPAPPDVVAASEEVTIVWTTPQTRGAEITGYTINSAVAGPRTVGLENSLTWQGLTNGTEYTFTVTAISSVGTSEESEPSLPVVPNKLPEAPSAPSVTFGDTELDVSWSEPENDGTEILAYELEIGGSLSKSEPVGLATSYTWTGLTNGQAYTFRVRAQNAAGWGTWSNPSSAATPVGLPTAPLAVTAQRGNLSGSLIIDWSAPTNDNGGDITNYQVIPSVGQPVALGTNDTSYDWSDLANGVEVTFQVQAFNRAGWGDVSAPSNPAIPCGAPEPPVITDATRLDKGVAISIQAPADNGCAITGYTITSDKGKVQSTTNTNFTFPNLTNGTSYRFSAVAINEMGSSDPGNQSAAVIPAGPPLCGGPGLNGSAVAPGEVLVGWGTAIDNGDPLTGYEITYDSTTVIAPVGSTQLIGGLADATTYSFSVRAVNSIGVSPICGSTTVTTWSLPTALNASKSFDANTDELTAIYTGGASPSNPITSWSASFSHGPTADREWSGTSSPPLSFAWTVVEDGFYGFTMQVCNAVGCVETTSCCDQITLVGPPDQMATPSMRFDWPSWDRFGVDVFAGFSRPADNGATITNYSWEKRWIGASGTWHNDDGVMGPDDELFVAFYPGYSSYYDSTSQGQTILWEVRVAAINAEGQGEWSDWGSIAPPVRTPHVVIRQGNFVPGCGQTEPPFDQLECYGVILEAHGMGANRSYQVSIEPLPFAGNCWDSIVTDNAGSFGGLLNGCLLIDFGTLQPYTAEIDGVFSPPTEVGS